MNTSSQRGSAIIMIFIAVGLFGLLAYAFMQGSRSNVSWLSTEEASSYATNIIGYSGDVRTAVARLRARGCADIQMNFENPYYATVDYANPNSPTDESCNIFSTKGGGLKFDMSHKAMIEAAAEDLGWPPFWFGSGDVIPGLGTDCAAASCAELIMSSWGVNKNVCIAINNKLGITNPGGDPPNDEMINWPLFKGTYMYTGPSIASIATQLTGKKSACIKAASCAPTITGGCYVYYLSLIER